MPRWMSCLSGASHRGCRGCSTHRDACGLAVLRPVVSAQPDPSGFHAYVSGDPTVQVDGTSLPVQGLELPEPLDVMHAVSSLTRTPVALMERRGPARSLYLRAARTLCGASHRRIGELVGVSTRTVGRARSGLDRDVRVVASVVRDPRFAPLGAGGVSARRSGML